MVGGGGRWLMVEGIAIGERPERGEEDREERESELYGCLSSLIGRLVIDWLPVYGKITACAQR